MTDLQSLGAAMGADIGADIGAVYDQLAPSIREAVKRGRPFHPAAPLIRNPEAYNRAIQNLHHHAHSPAVAHHPVLAKALQHHAILASTIARLEAQRKYEAKIKPTTVVGCNFDGVGAASLSPVATIGTPYQGQDYAITGFLVWGWRRPSVPLDAIQSRRRGSGDGADDPGRQGHQCHEPRHPALHLGRRVPRQDASAVYLGPLDRARDGV